ncbi:MAG: histidinol-phosphate transaminase [Bacteroidetes bacterium]|nr:histidinol-phosphate transaminase [Bacteroidota bacterium]
MRVDIASLVRPGIARLVPYKNARAEFDSSADIFLNANENSYGAPITGNFNRYPDPLQRSLKVRLACLNATHEANCFIGNGSDEVIDLLIRSFCEPGIDNVIICPPTYGMYEVSARINGVEVREAPLTTHFQLDTDAIVNCADKNTKLIFLCSPNNPTGNALTRADVMRIVDAVHALVVVDEAYWDYSSSASYIGEIERHNNVVVMRTLSKAWGLAGLRIGMAFADSEVIAVLNKVKPPYNVNAVSQQLALDAVENESIVQQWIRLTIRERENVRVLLEELPIVRTVFPSDANFLLVRVTSATEAHGALLRHGIVVRDRSTMLGCEQCVRITIGTSEENNRLIDVLKQCK